MKDHPFTVFVVEDNDWYNKMLMHNLALNPDFHVEGFTTAADVLKSLNKNPQVITLDYRLPDMDGGQLLEKIKAHDSNIEVIIISEQDDIETALSLLKRGAYDYFPKTDDIRDRLLNAVQHIQQHSGLKEKINVLQKEVSHRYQPTTSVIGTSKPIKEIMGLISKAAETTITVSISGETGTGKEVTAKAIHYSSKRKDRPFIAVNMAAVPSELMESELFGHEKGAFTGAVARRKGKFEEASGGTLFLDEIGELPLPFQAKLLRALQEKEIIRVGSNESIPVDCRIIVATSKNLMEEVEHKNFRDDLYYRLLGLPIHLPPLRERGDDILILARHFIGNFCEKNGLPEKLLTADAAKKLSRHSWPGNIRELKAVVELAVVMSNGDAIEADDLSLKTATRTAVVDTGGLSLREYNRRLVNNYMEKFNNNTRKVADALQIGQTTVYRLLKEEKEDQNDGYEIQ